MEALSSTDLATRSEAIVNSLTGICDWNFSLFSRVCPTNAAPDSYRVAQGSGDSRRSGGQSEFVSRGTEVTNRSQEAAAIQTMIPSILARTWIRTQIRCLRV